MWGNIILESYTHTLFNTGFNNQKTTIILYLLKWQYFWWFWFSYLFILYYNIFFNLILNQTVKFNPKITTTQKAHGKWGDVIICLLPIFWCVNILTNSNALLKSIEWQTESHSMLVRVRGKQWYWSYKISLKDIFNINNKGIIIGNGKKLIFNDLNNNINFIENNNKITYWRKKLHENKFTNAQLNSLPKDILSLYEDNNQFNYKSYLENIQHTTKIFRNTKSIVSNNNLNNLLNTFNMLSTKSTNTHLTNLNVNGINKLDIFNNNSFKFNNKLPYYSNNKLNNNLSNLFTNNLNMSLYISTKPKLSLFNSNTFSKNNLILTKNPLKNQNLLSIKFITNKSEIYRRTYITVKQEILKDKRKFSNNFLSTDRLEKQKELEGLVIDKFTISNRSGYNLINNRRLLNTKFLLVLPTKTNLTLITNSFDVVHSWFIPGLGLKMDCVPGRSTHHSLYIRTPGFYYGQCAEICGRLHHHMPIKVCFLPLEHFFVWWNHFHTEHSEIDINKYFRLE